MADISIPPNGLLAQINVDLFGLQVFFDAPGAKLAAKSGLSVTTPGSFKVSRLHGQLDRIIDCLWSRTCQEKKHYSVYNKLAGYSLRPRPVPLDAEGAS